MGTPTLYIAMYTSRNPDPETVGSLELDDPATAHQDVATALRELADEFERGDADYSVSPDAARWQPEEEQQ